MSRWTWTSSRWKQTCNMSCQDVGVTQCVEAETGSESAWRISTEYFNWPVINWRVSFRVVWRVKFHVKNSVRVREPLWLKLSNRVAVKFCLPQVYNNTTIILSLFIQSEGLELTRDRTRAAEGRMARSRVWEVATKMASGEGQGLDFSLWWRILDNIDILRNDMALELKLHSPAGAESIVYTWPLQKSVSFIGGAEILNTRLLVRSVLFCLSCLPETLSDCSTFRTAEMRRQKLWKPSGNSWQQSYFRVCVRTWRTVASSLFNKLYKQVAGIHTNNRIFLLHFCLRWVCADFPELKLAVENYVLREFDPSR